MSSSRLPGKALLPLGELSTVVLAARRASNKGLPLVVATSTDPSDDPLVRELTRHQIAVYRGPLTDVLARFVGASQAMRPEDLVVRLTADNVFPDGPMIEEAMAELLRRKSEYLTTMYPTSPLPYGMAVEVFTVKVLREAAKEGFSSEDWEHVTPWMKRKFSNTGFVPKSWKVNASHLRCTLDDLEDFRVLASLFEGIQDPVKISAYDLCGRLLDHSDSRMKQMPLRRKNSFLQSEMTLGTVQLGMKYGIVNETGQPSLDESIRIVHEAIGRGVNQIDCARGYGEAEKRVGLALEGSWKNRVTVITKLDPLMELEGGSDSYQISSAVDASLFRSCRELRLPRLPVVLLHRWQHRRSHRGMIWKRLLEWRSEGLIGSLGCSALSPKEACEALQDPDVRFLQIPFNLLARRWKSPEISEAIQRRSDVHVYARSPFLQGLLVSDCAVSEEVTGEKIEIWRRKIDALVERFGRESRADLCIAYVRTHSWVDSLVIGVESVAQLKTNLKLFQRNPLAEEECEMVEAELGAAPEKLTDPTRWLQKQS